MGNAGEEARVIVIIRFSKRALCSLQLKCLKRARLFIPQKSAYSAGVVLAATAEFKQSSVDRGSRLQADDQYACEYQCGTGHLHGADGFA